MLGKVLRVLDSPLAPGTQSHTSMGAIFLNLYDPPLAFSGW